MRIVDKLYRLHA